MGRLHAIVGDIHGCFDALRRLEDRVARHAAREGLEPHFVSVGDLVDRGPHSAQVVRHFRLGLAAGTHTALLGNHEQMMIASLHAHAPQLLEAAGCELPGHIVSFDASYASQKSKTSQWFPPAVFRWFRALMWLGQGGVPTLQSFGTSRPSEPESWVVDPDDVAFLCGLPLVWRTDEVVVTHALVSAESLAGLNSDDPEVFAQSVDQALWGRARPDEPPDPGRTHVSGHSIQRAVRRDRRRQLVQVDTGAFLGTRLAAWCAESDRVLTVKN